MRCVRVHPSQAFFKGLQQNLSKHPTESNISMRLCCDPFFLARPMLSPSSICHSKIFWCPGCIGLWVSGFSVALGHQVLIFGLHSLALSSMWSFAVPAGPQSFWDHANRASIHLGNCVPHAQTVLMGNRVDAFLLFRRLRRVSQILSASTADDKQQQKLGKGWSSHHGVWSSSRVGMIRPWSQLSTSFNHFQVNPCRCLQMFFFSNVMTVMISMFSLQFISISHPKALLPEFPDFMVWFCREWWSHVRVTLSQCEGHSCFQEIIEAKFESVEYRIAANRILTWLSFQVW